MAWGLGRSKHAFKGNGRGPLITRPVLDWESRHPPALRQAATGRGGSTGSRPDGKRQHYLPCRLRIGATAWAAARRSAGSGSRAAMVRSTSIASLSLADAIAPSAATAASRHFWSIHFAGVVTEPPLLSAPPSEP